MVLICLLLFHTLGHRTCPPAHQKLPRPPPRHLGDRAPCQPPPTHSGPPSRLTLTYSSGGAVLSLWAETLGFSRQEYWSRLSCPPPGSLVAHTVKNLPAVWETRIPSLVGPWVVQHAERPQFPCLLLKRTRGPDTSSKATQWVKAQHEAPLASRVAQGVSGTSSSCVWNPRVFADDIHQHTPYLSIMVAQHLLHGSSPIGSIITPPSLKT